MCELHPSEQVDVDPEGSVAAAGDARVDSHEDRLLRAGRHPLDGHGNEKHVAPILTVSSSLGRSESVRSETETETMSGLSK